MPEVQEGWKGHILPFELVQQELLADDLNELLSLESRLAEITSLYTEIIESLDVEEKEGSYLNETNDAFVSKELKLAVADILTDVDSEEISALKDYLKLSKKEEKEEYIQNTSEVSWTSMITAKDGTYSKAVVNNRIKQLQMEYAFDEDTLENKLTTALRVMEEERLLKKTIKTKSEELHLKTKEVIESLDEDTSLRLVELKWIKPLLDGLSGMTQDIINEFVNSVLHLIEKYETTFADVENNIESAGAELSSMISELEGNSADMEGLAELQRILEAN